MISISKKTIDSLKIRNVTCPKCGHAFKKKLTKANILTVCPKCSVEIEIIGSEFIASLESLKKPRK